MSLAVPGNLEKFPELHPAFDSQSAMAEANRSPPRNLAAQNARHPPLRSAVPAKFVTHPLAKPQVSAVRHGGSGEIT